MCFILVLADLFLMYDPHSLNVQFHKYKAMKSLPSLLWDPGSFVRLPLQLYDAGALGHSEPHEYDALLQVIFWL